MKPIYLDACILVAYYSKKKEEKKKKLVLEALKIISELEEVQLCTSYWAVTEMANILISKMKLGRAYASKCEEELLNKKRLKDIKINFIDVSPKNDYDFTEFFYDVRKGILKYHSGIGDIIHSVVMKNNKVKHILTFDEKEDFKQIPGLIVIHPKQFSCVSTYT